MHTSLDYLVGAGDKRWRPIETNGTRGLQIDDEMEMVHLLDRQFSRVGTLENAVNVGGGATPAHPIVVTVGHEKPVAGHDVEPGVGRQTPLGRKGRNSPALRKDRRSRVDVQSLHPLAHNGRESIVQVGGLRYRDRHHDEPETRCRLLLPYLEGGKGRDIFRAVDNADSLDPGLDFLEEFEVLSEIVSSWFTTPVMLPPGEPATL